MLGHRKHQTEAQTLPVGELTTRPYVSTCSTESDMRIRMLMKHFDEVCEVFKHVLLPKHIYLFFFIIVKHATKYLGSFQTSCWRSVNIGWDGGVYAQTCGHHVHVDCHSSYINSLKVVHISPSTIIFR